MQVLNRGQTYSIQLVKKRATETAESARERVSEKRRQRHVCSTKESDKGACEDDKCFGLCSMPFCFYFSNVSKTI